MFFFILIYKALAKIAIEKNICKIFLLNKQKEKNSAPYPLHSKDVSFFLNQFYFSSSLQKNCFDLFLSWKLTERDRQQNKP